MGAGGFEAVTVPCWLRACRGEPGTGGHGRAPRQRRREAAAAPSAGVTAVPASVPLLKTLYSSCSVSHFAILNIVVLELIISKLY